MSEKYEGLRRAAEKAKASYSNFCIASPEVILSLLQERDQLLARESPEDAWLRGQALAVTRMVQLYGHATEKTYEFEPYSAPKESKDG